MYRSAGTRRVRLDKGLWGKGVGVRGKKPGKHTELYIVVSYDLVGGALRDVLVGLLGNGAFVLALGLGVHGERGV